MRSRTKTLCLEISSNVRNISTVKFGERGQLYNISTLKPPPPSAPVEVDACVGLCSIIGAVSGQHPDAKTDATSNKQTLPIRLPNDV